MNLTAVKFCGAWLFIILAVVTVFVPVGPLAPVVCAAISIAFAQAPASY
jgi:hypothetical protein